VNGQSSVDVENRPDITVLQVARLVFRSDNVLMHDLVVVFSQLPRPELNGQLVELAGEAEWRLVVLVFHARAGIDADIEGLVTLPSPLSTK
jgi:hypothetical protein